MTNERDKTLLIKKCANMFKLLIESADLGLNIYNNGIKILENYMPHNNKGDYAKIWKELLDSSNEDYKSINKRCKPLVKEMVFKYLTIRDLAHDINKISPKFEDNKKVIENASTLIYNISNRLVNEFNGNIGDSSYEVLKYGASIITNNDESIFTVLIKNKIVEITKLFNLDLMDLWGKGNKLKELLD